MTVDEATYWIRVREAAQMLGVHEQTIRAMITRGQITAHRFGPRMIRVDRRTLVGELVEVAAK